MDSVYKLTKYSQKITDACQKKQYEKVGLYNKHENLYIKKLNEYFCNQKGGANMAAVKALFETMALAVEGMRRELSDTKEEVDKISRDKGEAIRLHDQQLRSLRSEHSATLANIALQGQDTRQAQALEALTGQLQLFKDSTTELEARLAEKDVTIVELQRRNEDLERQNGELQGQNRELQRRNEDLERQNGELQGQNRELQGDNNTAQREQADLLQRNTAMDATLKQAQNELQQAQTDLQQAESTIEEAAADAVIAATASLESRIEELEALNLVNKGLIETAEREKDESQRAEETLKGQLETALQLVKSTESAEAAAAFRTSSRGISRTTGVASTAEESESEKQAREAQGGARRRR
jgi:chromosome segregation ATPase